MAGCQVDFLPKAYTERRTRRRAWLLRGAVVAVVTAITVVSSTSVSRRTQALSAELGAITIERQRARDRIAQVEQLDLKKGDLARRLQILEEVLSGARASPVLEAVAVSCPDTVQLQKVNLRLDTTGHDPFLQISVEGHCPDHLDVANLQGAMAHQPLLDAVNVVLSEKVGLADARIKFVLTAVSSGRLELDTAEDPDTAPADDPAPPAPAAPAAPVTPVTPIAEDGR